MRLNSVSPVAVLRDYVLSFQQREAQIDGARVILPIAARPEQILEFYLQDRYLIRACDSGTEDLAPRAVVVGPFTYHRVDLLVNGRFDVFTIHFQPTGFHRLFGISMVELADHAYEAHSVLGAAIAEIEQRLADTADFVERTRTASEFLLRYATPRTIPDAVARMANQFLVKHGAIRIGSAAASAGLSIRQFERSFCRQVGVPPKLYARIARFCYALESKRNMAARPWTDIAYELGYYDQMHMIRDFETFSDDSPTCFFKRLALMAEPWA